MIKLSGEMKKEFVNMSQVKEFTSDRLDTAMKYRDKLILIENIPAPLENFHNCELDFVNSDIKTIELVLSYYDSGNYSIFNELEIKKLYADEEFFKRQRGNLKE